MGATRTVKVAGVTAAPPRRVAGLRLNRGRPRHFAEWRTLRSWGKLPPWEEEVAGYLLRLAREHAGLTQAGLAERLGICQQAVVQSERWSANPTVELIRRRAEACGLAFLMVLEPAS
jgi:DNA-binding XRE family transcriptional regulator